MFPTKKSTFKSPAFIVIINKLKIKKKKSWSKVQVPDGGKSTTKKQPSQKYINTKKKKKKNINTTGPNPTRNHHKTTRVDKNAHFLLATPQQKEKALESIMSVCPLEMNSENFNANSKLASQSTRSS